MLCLAAVGTTWRWLLSVVVVSRGSNCWHVVMVYVCMSWKLVEVNYWVETGAAAEGCSGDCWSGFKWPEIRLWLMELNQIGREIDILLINYVLLSYYYYLYYYYRFN